MITIALAVGRFQPPTREHEQLFDKLFSIPADKHFVFVIGKEKQTCKNPLTLSDRCKLLQRLYPGKIFTGTLTPVSALVWIWLNFYENRESLPREDLKVIMVGGIGKNG